MPKHFFVGLAVAGLLLVPARGFACRQDQSQQNQQPSSQSNPPPSSQQNPSQKSDAQAKPSAQSTDSVPAKPDPIVAAARKAREEKKDQSKPAKIFTNDNIPTTGGVSAVGETSATAGGDAKAVAQDNPTSLDAQEKMWRERFSKLRHKLEQDQQELDVMQRELGVLDVQYYSNPVKAMQQDLTRSDINKKTSDIDAKKAQIEADKQAISDAEDDLRKAGGDPGWAR